MKKAYRIIVSSKKKYTGWKRLLPFRKAVTGTVSSGISYNIYNSYHHNFIIKRDSTLEEQ